MLIDRTSSEDFSLRLASYVIKGLMLMLKREYDAYYKANQAFIVQTQRHTLKETVLAQTTNKKKLKRKEEDNNKHEITDLSLFNSESLISDTFDQRLFGKQILGSLSKERSLSSKSKNPFLSPYESGNKTINELLAYSKSKSGLKQSIKKFEDNIRTKVISPKFPDINAEGPLMINLNNKNANNLYSVDVENNNPNRVEFNDNSRNDQLEDFIDFDIQMDPLINQKNKDSNNKEEKANGKDIANEESKKDYFTPIKLITSEHKPKEILKRFNSSNYHSAKGVKFLLKEQSNNNTNAKSKNQKLLYDGDDLLLTQIDINQKKTDEDIIIKSRLEIERYKALFKKYISHTALSTDFTRFKMSLAQVKFDRALLVTEEVLLNKDFNTKKKDSLKKSVQSSCEQLRYAERAETSSLDNSASVLSNLSLKDVFDTNKKLINKMSTVINYPAIVGIIEEEDSNFNLNSMNTFNLKTQLNNNNNNAFDFNFDEINEEDKENDDNNNSNAFENLYHRFKALEAKKALSLNDLAHWIEMPSCSNKAEMKALAFYHLLLYAQRNDILLIQQKPFSSIYVQ